MIKKSLYYNLSHPLCGHPPQEGRAKYLSHPLCGHPPQEGRAKYLSRPLCGHPPQRGGQNTSPAHFVGTLPRGEGKINSKGQIKNGIQTQCRQDSRQRNKSISVFDNRADSYIFHLENMVFHKYSKRRRAACDNRLVG